MPKATIYPPPVNTGPPYAAVPLNLLFWATASFVIPWFWPLG
ncbi:MAG: hypothetical protein ACFCUQ_12615 [Kiloniellales bacterium]